ncbi:polysaccharide biosynthesis tyrosine autokinase [Actinoplanes sp. NPDC051343]|uniref:polysaccharide biosynthesis tyrosine autokinase n=1 Tax=Actinoplanes sp. NPDC051343 TaxID=3363906 RepID=UPI0037B6F954
MGLRDYIRVARRHWWIVAASIVLALTVALVVTFRMPKTYAADVTFFFTTPNAQAADLYPASMFSQARLKSYAALLTSDRIIVPLAATPGLGVSRDDLVQQITSQTVADTVMLVVSVQDRSRQKALQTVTALTPLFEKVVGTLENTGDASKPTIRVEVVAGPELEPDPVSPKILNNLSLAGLAGLMVGAALAVAREVSDSSLRTAEALQTLIGAPVLAQVPIDTSAPSRSGPFVSDPQSPRAEALRRLRTNLQYADADRPVQVVAVTSAVPAEGRSATACSLALLFAESGGRVLIVDAELRHPRLAAFLGRENAAGLSTVLTGAVALDEVLQPWGAGLWLLSSGQTPPNPSELLSSSRMTDLVEELRGRFDVVIFDCPPLLPVTDAAVIAARSDGALFVARARRTKSAQVTGAVRALHAVNARILGGVLNMVPAKGHETFPAYETATAAEENPKIPSARSH